MAIRPTTSSAYSATPVLGWYTGVFNPVTFTPASDDQTITVSHKYAGRADLLAYDLYGSEEFAWVFAMRNPELRTDPFFGMKLGQIIYAPTRDRVLRGRR